MKSSRMNARLACAVALSSVWVEAFLTNPSSARADFASDAHRILAESGIQGGFIVHVGCGEGRLASALRQNPGIQVQGLDRNAQKIDAGREQLLREKRYGEVSLESWEGGPLPYIDNLVNLLVLENPDDASREEIQRVLVPNGVALIKRGEGWEKITKKRPPEMDDWTHYFYSAKGNPTSHDLLVAPPERLQWVGNPRWSRHHDRISSLSAQVSSGGRLFYIMDEGSRISALLPSHWTLTARDAFNGTILWKQPIERWQPHLWPLKSGPTQLTRRLVAHQNQLFVTLGIEAPVSLLDGATGRTLRQYEGTRGTEEILHVEGKLYLLVNPESWSLNEFAPKLNTGDQKRVESEFNWDEKPRELHVVDAQSGKLLWKKTGKIAPLTLTTDGKRVVFHDGQRLVCLDAKSGGELWKDVAAKRKLFEYNYGPRIVLEGDVVLYAGGDGAMKGLDATNGQKLWEAPHNKSGYRSPEDLIVASGLVWNAPTTSGGMSGEFIGRDPRTGEAKVQFPPDVNTYWFHHRCYIAKATDRFILPSRTGIEFVDLKSHHWDINHWVRSACLYGSMPCNGLLYASPHNCACYPEAKLDGLNALAPTSQTPHPAPPKDDKRLIKGPAYGQNTNSPADPKDWPTYRHDAARSGFTDQKMLPDLSKAWESPIEGRLSALTIAGSMVFVSQIDAHTLHALDMVTGKPLWHFIAGGRIDSPPTYSKGYLFFGCKDGRVYSLRASDGVLAWRYEPSAPRHHMAHEQLESVWPVHGSVLVENDSVAFVAGRSIFLDGGLRFFKLNTATGQKIVEVTYDEKDPENGRDIQERIKTLQMPVGLNDILSSDGHWTFLRTQKIGPDGQRVEIGPVSGNAPEQGAAQKGEGSHLFAPMGFLDDSWFHRSYWVYGKNFAGGHNGYYQAGKYAPAGRILVFNDNKVFGYGREPQYYKWTTTMEHQLFSASRTPPDAEPPADSDEMPKKAGAKAKGQNPTLPGVRFPDSPKLNPASKAITVEAWILADGQNGVILAHGGPINGYALTLQDGEPTFHIRAAKTLSSASSKVPLSTGWHHLAAVLDSDKSMRLYLDGKLEGSGSATALLPERPKQALEIGQDSGGSVGDYPEDFGFSGLIDELALYYRALSAEEIRERSLVANARSAKDASLACSFDKGDARDDSANGLHGVVSGLDAGKGKNGGALWFHKALAKGRAGKTDGKKNAKKDAGSFVAFDWTRYVPVVTRAMAMSGDNVFVAGPPNFINEEYAFERLTQKDPAILEELAHQDASLNGERGGTLYMVNVQSGEVAGDFKLDRPPVWDGMAIAHGRIFVSTTDGRVQCYGTPKP